MNRLILEESDFISPDVCRITGRRFRQLVDVIKSPVGKVCKAGKVNGLRGTAQVIAVGSEDITLKVTLDEEPPDAPAIRLAIAMQRPQTFSKVLHIATTMGVKRILFFHSFKVEKSYWQSPRIKSENFRHELIEALEQCGDTTLPQVEFCDKFKEFYQERLGVFSQGTQAIFGDPPATAEPADFKKEAVTLILGPEGGFTDYETQVLRDCGALGVTLGARILRTEYALAALLGKLI